MIMYSSNQKTIPLWEKHNCFNGGNSGLVRFNNQNGSSQSHSNELSNTMDQVLEQQNESPMSKEEFVENIKQSFYELSDLSQMIRFIKNTTKFLKKYHGLHCHYQELFRINFIVLDIAIIDHQYFYENIHHCLNEFFLEFEKKCLESTNLGSSNQSMMTTLNTKTETFSQEWSQSIMDENIVNQLLETLSKTNDDKIITLTTVPIALNTLLSIGIVFDVSSILPLLEKIAKVIEKRCDDNLPIDNEYWSMLASKVSICIHIYTMINLANRFDEQEVQQLTLILVNTGLMGDDLQNKFYRIMIRQAIKDLCATLVLPQLNLFRLFQNEISQLLIEKLNANFQLKMLYESMEFFTFKTLPNELLSWIIPAFVVKCNENTKQLLDHFTEKPQWQRKPKKLFLKPYMQDIMVYLFYECKADVQLIYRVIQWLSDYCKTNVFTIVRDMSKTLICVFLQKISKDRQITLQALSFLALTSKKDDVEPSSFKIDSILKMDLDMYEKNENKFRNQLNQKLFMIYIHQIDRYLVIYNYNISEKITLAHSFELILHDLERAQINQFRVKIYFIIRQLLLERFHQNANIFEIGLKILDYFIINVQADYLEMEMLSICLLIVPLVKRFPKEICKLLVKLLSLHQYPTWVYYQLCFIPNESSVLKPIIDLVNQRLNQFVTKSSIPVLMDTNNNEQVSSLVDFSDPNQLVKYLRSIEFSLKCREIYFLMENLDIMDDRLQEVILRQLYQRLDSNKELFYRIYLKRSIKNFDFECHFRDLIIDLKITKSTTVLDTMSIANTTDQTIQISLSNFFRRIIICLFRCLKFSQSTEINKLATNCLGVLGAISVRFLNFDQPFQVKDFNKTGDKRQPNIDYSNVNLFNPKKRSFKLLILDILMNMIGSSITLNDYNSASFALQELLPYFSDRNNVVTYLLGLNNNVNSEMAIDDLLSTQQIELYIRNNLQHTQNQTSINSTSQENEKIDRLKQFIHNENNEHLNLDDDLQGELRNYRLVLDRSLFSSKEWKRRPTEMDKMDEFFQSIRPSLSYMNFVQRFIHMLYHNFITSYDNNKNSRFDEPTTTFAKVAENSSIRPHETIEMFSQYLCSAVPNSQRHNSNYFDKIQEIKSKIERLQTAEKIFTVCYHVIFHNMKLSYVLLPCLMLLSLRFGSTKMHEQFARHYQHMIRVKFLGEPSMFTSGELGQMAGELFCHIYDFLRVRFQQRLLAHSVITNHRLFRQKCIENADQEFLGIKAIFESVDIVSMAQLAYYAGSPAKALNYMEHHLNDLRNIHQTAIENENQNYQTEFIRKHCQIFIKIYHALNDLDAVSGLNTFIINANKNSKIDLICIENQFHKYLLNENPVGQLICGSKLFFEQKNDKIHQYDLQKKYFQSLIDLDQYVPSMNNSKESNFAHHALEATWRLNCWDNGLLNYFSRPQLFFDGNNNNNIQFSPTIGYILHSMHQGESPFLLDSKISDLRQIFLAPLNAALLTNTMTAYGRAYDQTMVSVHIMHDVQQFISVVYNRLLANDDDNHGDGPNSITSPNQSKIQKLFNDLINDWRLRNQLLPEGKIRQQVLDVQRSLIHLLKHHKPTLNISKELFRYWHESIRCSLNGGCLNRAFISLVEAIRIQETTDVLNQFTDEEQIDFLLDQAQVFWIQNNQQDSIDLLRCELENRYGDLQKHCHMETLKNFSQIPEQDLIVLSTVLSLKLTKQQFQQMSTSTSSSFRLGGNESSLMRVSTSAHSQSHMSTTFIASKNPEDLAQFGRLQLRYAQYCERAGHMNSHALIILYKAVAISCPQWEEAHFQLAMFFRRLFQQYQKYGQSLASKTAFNLGKPDEILDLKLRVVKSLCESLKFGSPKMVQVSLPTLLNIWIDLGYECINYEKKYGMNNQNRQYQVMRDLLKRITERTTSIIEEMVKNVNNAIFFLDLDLLIGHMLHPFEQIEKMIQTILAKLIVDFPYHMVWQLSRSLNSIGQRSTKSRELIQMANKLKIKSHKQNDSFSITKYFEQFRQFSNQLTELANYKPPKNRSNGQQNECILPNVSPGLMELMEQLDYPFILPLNRFFLPNSLKLERMSIDNQKITSNLLFINKFADRAAIMKSLQMPKKLTIFASDGTKHIVLVKNGDDLRRDRAMLNVCNLYNQCRRGEINPDCVEPMSSIESRFDMATEMKIWSRRSREPLSIQTYFVVPLSDVCGVIEWIPGLSSMKSLVEEQYMKSKYKTQKYLSSKSSYVKSVFKDSRKDKRVERFIQWLPSFQPPVFQNWFLENFADSHSWYLARTNFTRTAAVFSMLGYIMGLCDRHTENILIDPTNGQVVQVDFNCLFNKGEEFLVPECVPFRLTHNMIAAMGSLGYEEHFRATCEDVLLVLRQFRELFSKQVTIFLYDMFDDWTQRTDRIVTAEKAVFNVEARLFGITSRTSRKLPQGNIMSISGQVNHVIKESTDINNLGSMYHGWASFI